MGMRMVTHTAAAPPGRGAERQRGGEGIRVRLVPNTKKPPKHYVLTQTTRCFERLLLFVLLSHPCTLSTADAVPLSQRERLLWSQRLAIDAYGIDL